MVWSYEEISLAPQDFASMGRTLCCVGVCRALEDDANADEC